MRVFGASMYSLYGIASTWTNQDTSKMFWREHVHGCNHPGWKVYSHLCATVFIENADMIDYLGTAYYK